MPMRIRQAAILFGAVILIGLLVLAVINFARHPSTARGPKPAIKQLSVNASNIATPAKPGTSIPHTPTARVMRTASRLPKQRDQRVAARWMSPSQARKIKLPHGFHLAQIPWTGGLRHDTLPPNVTSRAPPLDRQRQAADQTNAASGNSHITFTSNFSCGTPVNVKRVSATHYILTVTGPEVATSSSSGTFHLWFLIRLSGVKGKIIRLDFTDSMIKACQFANPLYSYCSNLNNPKNFVSKPAINGRAQFGYNGPILPDTSGQKWHFVVNVWREGKNLCLVQKFTHNHVYLSLRYPYTPKLNEVYMARLQGNPYCQVVTVGQSKDGRPLLAVEIPRPGNTPADKAKPCVLIYAREHADEVDSGWVAYGAMRFLLSAKPEAQKIRKQMQFIIIPMLDPDGAAGSFHHDITDTFVPGNPAADTKEAIEYTNFLQQWINSGRRIDIVNNLHEGQPAGKPDFYCPAASRTVVEFRAALHALQYVKQQVTARGYSSSGRVEGDSAAMDRLIAFTHTYYGAMVLPFEVNPQGVYRHLSLYGIRQIGDALAQGESQFLQSGAGKTWDQQIHSLLRQRARDWKQYGRYLNGEPALLSERGVQWKVRNARLRKLIAREGLAKVVKSRPTGRRSPGDPW